MKFNIRVYGILIHEEKVLLSDEDRFNHQFTKFPGGGLEFEEGVWNCLQREFQEELEIQISNPRLFYINENFVPSAFNESDQIIAIYYLVDSSEINKIDTVKDRFDFNDKEQVFRFEKIEDIRLKDFRFPIDKMVVDKLKKSYS